MIPLRPLHRQLAIGLTVSLLAAAGLGAAWWTTQRADDSFASRLPADAVLAYIERPRNDTSMMAAFARLAPGIGFPREIDNEATALAIVRTEDGTEGWMTFKRDASGKAHVTGTDPSFGSLLSTDAARLADDDRFRALRWKDETNWAYVAYPEYPADASPLSRLLALDAPVAFRMDDAGRTVLRLWLRPTPRMGSWTGRPLAMLTDADHVLSLPAWNAMERMGALLTPDARAVAESLATTFVHDVAAGASLRYDAAELLAGPSLLQLGTDGSGNTVFSLEGRGSSPAETDRVLRMAHERFAATRGSARVRTVSTEGYSLHILTQEREADTMERTDGEIGRASCRERV